MRAHNRASALCFNHITHIFVINIPKLTYSILDNIFKTINNSLHFEYVNIFFCVKPDIIKFNVIYF